MVVESLQRLLAPILRLDADDPVEEWRSHVATLHARAEALESASLRAVRFHDCADTDLRVGLLRCARWPSGAITTNWGRVMVVNVPTDEVFTTPDNRLTEGTVAATRPFQLLGGSMIEGARRRFEGGRVVEVDADRNADTFRAHLASTKVRRASARLHSSTEPHPSAAAAVCSTTSSPTRTP